MTEFGTISVKEAQLRTMSGRQGKYVNEYASYIQKLTPGQAGWIRFEEDEKPLTIKRRLTQAAQALDTQLIIKRSGDTLYFWKGNEAEEQPRPRRGRRPKRQEQTAEQYFSETGELDQGEIRQTAE